VKILITGGNGYIATALKKFLSSKYIVTSISRQDFDLENEYKTNEWFNNKTFDAVIHTATKGGSRLKGEDESVLTTNIKMFNNLLSNKSKFNKLISFGSGAEIFQKNTFYGKSKLIINDLIQEQDNFYNIRIFGVFDENELETRFIKSNILRYLNREPIEIHANKLMDFFHMKDLLSLVDYYLTSNPLEKIINCSYLEKVSLLQIANIINDLDIYKVNIKFATEEIAQDYCGTSILPIKVIGLKNGIENTFRKLKE
jgi:GDP-L-fucose synthase